MSERQTVEAAVAEASVEAVARRYEVRVIPAGDAGYWARVPAWPTVLNSNGPTPEAALASAYDGIATLLDHHLDIQPDFVLPQFDVALQTR